MDLKSRLDVYFCLLPCWSKTDLHLLGDLIFNYTADEMDERYYYSGGSVREFTLANVKQTINNIHSAISAIEDAGRLLSCRSDHLSHLFVKNVSDRNHFTRFRCRRPSLTPNTSFAISLGTFAPTICIERWSEPETPAVIHWPKSLSRHICIVLQRTTRSSSSFLSIQSIQRVSK